MKNLRLNKSQTADIHFLFGFLMNKIMAGEIHDESSFNQAIEALSNEVGEVKEFSSIFEEYLNELLDKPLEITFEAKTKFPLIIALLTHLEGNYLEDIHLGTSSKNLGAMINKWLEYSISNR